MTVVQIPATSSTVVRENLPASVEPTSDFLRLNAASGAAVRSLIDVPRSVPIGVDATVLSAVLRVSRVGTWPVGDSSVTVAPIDEPFDSASVTWSGQPAVRTGLVVTIPGGGSDADLIDLNVTSLLAASVDEDDATGSEWFGLRLSVAAGTVERRLYSAAADPDLVPVLIVEYALPPEAPDDPVPSAGQVVSVTKPELSATWNDDDADDALTSIAVEVSTTETFDVLVYESGVVGHTRPRFNLNAPPSGAPAAPALTVGQTYFWRMMVVDRHGRESDWMEPASFVVGTRGTLAITSPVGPTITNPIPVISWTVTGAVQESAEVVVERLDGSTWREFWRWPLQVTTLKSIVIPDDHALQSGQTYRITPVAFDAEHRADMPNDRAFMSSSVVVTVGPVT